MRRARESARVFRAELLSTVHRKHKVIAVGPLLAAVTSSLILPSAAFAALNPVKEANPARYADMNARSTGNDLNSAHKIAYRVFAKIEQIQVLKVRVDQVGSHRVAGMRLSGVKFHGNVTKAVVLEETQRLALDALSAAPVEECDIEILVPLSIGHTAVASNDSGMPPTERTVFTLMVRRGESAASLARRVARGEGVYIDPEFAQSLGSYRNAAAGDRGPA